MPAEKAPTTPADREERPSFYHHDYDGGLHELLSVIRTNERGKPETFGASPLSMVVSMVQQHQLLKELNELTYVNVPDDVPLHIREFVADIFAQRFWARCAANDEKYTSALIFQPDGLDDEEFGDDIEGENNNEETEAIIREMILRAQHGHASPAELLFIRDVIGMGGIELASLTFLYGSPERQKMLTDMRRSVKNAVQILGGEYDDEPEAHYKVKYSIDDDTEQPSYDKGLLMTRKRILGHLPDGTVIAERSSFVLRTDVVGLLTDDEKAAMQAISLRDPDWQQKVAKAGNLDTKVPGLIENDAFSIAIPISVTIYAYHPATMERIEQLEQKRVEERRQSSADETEFGLESSRSIEDIHGMYYDGPAMLAQMAIKEVLDADED